MASLSDTSNRVGSQFSNALEAKYLKQAGIVPRGIWFGEAGKAGAVSKDKIEQTLASNNVYMMKRVDILDSKVTLIGSKIDRLNANVDSMLVTMGRDRQGAEIAAKEANKGLGPGEGATKTTGGGLTTAKGAGNAFLLSMLPMLLVAAIQNSGIVQKFADYVLPSINLAKKVASEAGEAFSLIKGGISKGAQTVFGGLKDTARGMLGLSQDGAQAAGAAGSEIGTAAREGGAAAREGGAIAKVASGAFKGAVKIGSKAVKILSYLTGFKLALKLLPGAGVVLSFLEPMIALYNSGGEITTDVKKSFVKALGGFIGGWGGGALGAAIGTCFFPAVGTLAGGLIGMIAGQLGGEYVAEKIAEIIWDDKNAEDIWKEMQDDLMKATTAAAGAVVDVGKQGINAVSNFLGFGDAVEPPKVESEPATTQGVTPQGGVPITPGAAGGGGAVAEAKMTPGQQGNAQSAMTYLMSKGGFTKEQAAGIVGNLMGESQLNPNSLGDKNSKGEYTAHGIAQWHADRWNPFLTWCQKNGKNPYTVEAQLDWVIQELNTTERAAGKMLKGAKTSQQATDIIMNYYERPAVALRSGESVRRGGLALAAIKGVGDTGTTAVASAEGSSGSAPTPVPGGPSAPAPGPGTSGQRPIDSLTEQVREANRQAEAQIAANDALIAKLDQKSAQGSQGTSDTTNVPSPSHDPSDAYLAHHGIAEPAVNYGA